MKTIITTAIALLITCSAFAKPRDCEANYTHNQSNFTGLIDLGKVGGMFVNKKKQCKERAQNEGPKHVKANLAKLNLPALSSANWANYCKNGVTFYFDTHVEGKKNTKDGSFGYKPGCTYGNGACIQYQQVFDRGSF